MDQHAIYLGAFHFEMVFKGGNYIVDAPHFHRVGQRAMTGDLNFISHSSNHNLVNVDDLRQYRRSMAQMLFDQAIA